MSVLKSRWTFLALTALAACVIWGNYFFALWPSLAKSLKNTLVFAGAFGLGVGLYRMTTQHVKYIQSRKENQWMYSALFLGTYFVILILGLLPPMSRNDTFLWFYYNVGLPIDATMGAIVAFFYIQGAARGFKIRSTDSLILAVSSIIMIMRNAPIGSVLWGGFPVIGDWILNVPTTGMFRGIVIGTGIGLIAMVVRTLLGKERSFHGKED